MNNKVLTFQEKAKKEVPLMFQRKQKSLTFEDRSKPDVGEEILLNQEILKTSTKLMIDNVEVYFPFKPYDVQADYMSSVIKTLSNNKQNALLQSPTGTGKTLSLLCASLAWLRQSRLKAPIRNKENTEPNFDSEIKRAPYIKIIYASRTHSQLIQVIKELKTTVFQPKICILGSRDQSCIKPEFRSLRGGELNQACQKAITGVQKDDQQTEIQREGSCQYFNKENIIWLAGEFSREIMDIEEVKMFGSRKKACPYFFERYRKETADIIFMPYNYLLCIQLIHRLENQFSEIVNVANSIIIFDEAHNVAGVAEEGASFKLTSRQIDDAEKELSKWIDFFLQDNNLLQKVLKKKSFEQQDSELTIGSVKNTLQALRCFVQFMLASKQDKRFVVTNQLTHEKGFILEGIEIFQLLFNNTKDNSGCFNFHPGEKFSDGITEKNLNAFVEEGYEFMNIVQEIMPGYHFEGWMQFIKEVNRLFQENQKFKQQQIHQPTKNHWIDNPINHYKLCISCEENDDIVLNMWCLDPGQAFKRLEKKEVHSIILTSGTLTPFSSWESELRIPFKTQLNCAHVTDVQKNLVAGILKKGQDGTNFDFGFQNRDNTQMFDELGLALINMCGHIPNGVLVIFSSYPLMNKCKFVWGGKEKRILSRLHSLKPCFWEPKNATELKDIFEQYSKAALSPKGAIMFAVCRGKVAEGIDFSDKLCRAVFIVGIPFPPIQDKKIEQKKAQIDKIYNDTSIKEFKKINSKEWYNQQAVRSTNQALGRVIRHINDYGAIYLCDVRFEWQAIRIDISSWVQPVLKIWSNFSEGYKCSIEFFATKKISTNAIDNQLINDEQDEEEIKQSDLPPKKRIHQFFGLTVQNKEDISEMRKMAQNKYGNNQHK